jgi:hypothetical protein
MKKIGIVGTRRRDAPTDLKKVNDAFLIEFLEGDEIVSGGCPKGGDRFAEVIADTYKVPITIHKPDWKKNGQGAGFVRNTDIAKESDVLIACVFPNPDTEDRKGGTEDTIKKFKKFHPDGKVVLV